MATTEDDTVIERYDQKARNSATPRNAQPGGTIQHSATHGDSKQPGRARRFLLALLRALSAWNT